MTQDLAGIHYRLATLGERAEVGELRWALKTDDGPVDEKARAAFVARFLAWHYVSRTEAGVFHWVASAKGTRTRRYVGHGPA